MAFLIAELAALHYYGDLFLAHFKTQFFATPPDFLCFWTNGAIALGHLPATAAASASPFMYPPPFLLIAAPLSCLPPKLGYLLWLGGTNLCFAMAARWSGMSSRSILLGLLSPPNLYCIATGQTGSLTAALELAAFGLVKKRPVTAGLAASLLIIKPQFMLLAPVCFAASGNRRALAAFLAGVPLWCLTATLLFGPDIWRHFLLVETTTARMVLEQPWPQPYEGIMVSWFMMLRSLGATLSLAYAVQLLVSLAAACAMAVLWFRNREGNDTRLTATLCLTMLVTPYGYLYDIPALAASLANNMELRQQTALVCAGFWLVSALYLLISMTSFVSGAMFLSLLAGYFWQMEKSNRRIYA